MFGRNKEKLYLRITAKIQLKEQLKKRVSQVEWVATVSFVVEDNISSTPSYFIHRLAIPAKSQKLGINPEEYEAISRGFNGSGYGTFGGYVSGDTRTEAYERALAYIEEVKEFASMTSGLSEEIIEYGTVFELKEG